MGKRLAKGLLAVLTVLSVVLVLVAPVWKPGPATAVELKSFTSEQELASYIRRNTELVRQLGYGVDRGRPVMKGEVTVHSTGGPERLRAAAPTADQKTKSDTDHPDYSRTNVQVAGVDEADLVKSDGRNLYLVSDSQVVIMAAYPASQARVLGKIDFGGNPLELFASRGVVTVFGHDPDGNVLARVYDTTNQGQPVLKKEIKLRGRYVTSRMIGDHVYLIVQSPVEEVEGDIKLPWVSVDGKVKVIPPKRIYYFDCPDYSYQYTQIIAVNPVDNKEGVGSRTLLTGISQNVFASTANIYLTHTKTPDLALYTGRLIDGLAGLVPPGLKKQILAIKNSSKSPDQKLSQVEEVLETFLDSLDYGQACSLEEKIRDLREKWYRDMERERNKTTIHKLAVKNNSIGYCGRAEVPGQVLNQFSMDEYRGYFRVATTSESWLLTNDRRTCNNIYVLDGNLKLVGKLQGLAPGERIYSARFMGTRAYLVTFRQVDPLFAIDLKNPRAPRVLGQLKIPGFSQYLHPYDENHIIGIGLESAGGALPEQNPKRGEVSTRIWPPPPQPRPQKLKLSFFDVSNPAQPRELARFLAEDYSSSAALNDHKAVLFSKDKHLLVIPVSISRPVVIMSNPGSVREIHPWEGAYVFQVGPEQGIALKGKVQHFKDGGSRSGIGAPVKRSLYIDDVLYTVSQRLAKMNRITDLKEIGQVEF